MPNVLSNERFGLRLMLLIVSLKLLGLSYAKITSLFKLIFNLEMSEASVEHSVMKVAEAFGPRYSDLISEVRNEKSLHGDETSGGSRERTTGSGRLWANGRLSTRWQDLEAARFP